MDVAVIPKAKGKARNVGYARQDQVIAELGSDGYLDMIASRVAEGEKPWEIAHNLGYPYLVMRSWLESDKERMGKVDLGLRCFADKLAYQALDEVKDATTDDVQLRKLRSDVYDRRAKQYDKSRYGEKQQIEHSGGVTIVATPQDADL